MKNPVNWGPAFKRSICSRLRPGVTREVRVKKLANMLSDERIEAFFLKKCSRCGTKWYVNTHMWSVDEHFTCADAGSDRSLYEDALKLGEKGVLCR